MKVLVCDDDLVVLKLIEVALQGENLEVVLAEDGRKARKLLEDASPYDLIITDIHMPYHNGDEVLSWVREEQKLNTPIIMLSSDGEEEVIKMALKLGINAFLVKPVNTKDLIKQVKKLLKK